MIKTIVSNGKQNCRTDENFFWKKNFIGTEMGSFTAHRIDFETFENLVFLFNGGCFMSVFPHKENCGI